MKDKHETLSDIGTQKSALRNIHDFGVRGGGISSCAVLLHSVTNIKRMIRDNGNEEQVIFYPRMQLSCECLKDIMPSYFLAVSVLIMQSFIKTKNTINIIKST